MKNQQYYKNAKRNQQIAHFLPYRAPYGAPVEPLRTYNWALVDNLENRVWGLRGSGKFIVNDNSIPS